MTDSIAKKGTCVPCALTVAGSDSGGGAGIQADLLTFANLGVHGLTAIAALTSQNPDGVSFIQTASVKSLKTQMEAVYNFFKPKAAKCGMLFDAPRIRCVAKFFSSRPDIKLVVDPVCVATSKAVLLKPEALETLEKLLLPKAFLITPNLDEAALLLGVKSIDAESLGPAAAAIAKKFGVNVLLKGGHLNGKTLLDALSDKGGNIILRRSAKRIDGVNTHGSGCTLSAAITAFLAKGKPLRDSVEAAQDYLRRAMANPVNIAGQNFINRIYLQGR